MFDCCLFYWIEFDSMVLLLSTDGVFEIYSGDQFEDTVWFQSLRGALFVTAQLRIASDAHSLNGWVWSKAPWYTRYEFP